MTRTSLRFVTALALAVIPLVGCGGGSSHADMVVGLDPAPPRDMADDLASTHDGSLDVADLSPMGDAAAAPIVAADGTWKWVDVDGAVCNDGTQTGIGVNPGTDKDKILFYFEGGGACGDYGSCFQLKTATVGPFGTAQFDARKTQFGSSTMDRNASGNPFATWTYVYVPYCTGDLHGGIHTATYTSGAASQEFHHNGHINALRDLDRVAATWSTATQVVVSGSSAGGYGALINFADARNHWPAAKAYLVDDSGPPLEETSSSAILSTWISSWHLINWFQVGCPECVSDFSLVLPNVSKRFPNDRLSLLSSLQDKTIRGFYILDPAEFQAALLKLEADHLDALTNFKYFFIPGESHTMLGDYKNLTFTSKTTTLATFLDQQVTDSADWFSTKP